MRAPRCSRFTVDVALAVAAAGLTLPPRASAQQTEPDGGRINVHRIHPDDSILSYRRSLTKGRPALRGFRAPILENAHAPWPIDPPGDDAPAALRRAADGVARRLARDGLLAATARAIERLGPANFLANGTGGADLLWAVGLPVDLLAFFPPPGEPSPQPDAVVRHIAGRLAAGETADSLRPKLDAIPFRFIKSRQDFRVAVESGEHDIGTLRLQLPTGAFWKDVGDGSCVDLARQLVAALPEAAFLVCIEEKHLDEFLSLARGWPVAHPARLSVLVESMPIAQWTQDNGKPGFVGSQRSNTQRIATLVPRYASRGEESTVFVPEETFVADHLAEVGHTVIQSPLLFQGGNLMPVRDPAAGRRVLLIGEAEIYRNTALGLTREQVLEAFRLEFAVDRCVVLPAVSFHIDFELCVRVHDGRLIAFVNDTASAARIILSLGIDALEAHGALDAAAAQEARAHLKAGRDADFVTLVGGPVARQADANGYFPESLAKFFAIGPADAPTGNLQRFLLAMDILASATLKPEEMPADRYARAFVRALQHQDADRRALHDQLRRLGWRLVGVPSLANEDRSINYLNGIHDRTRYVMPAYGGFYAPLDRAAEKVFTQTLGPQVAVVPLLCAESQRRLGAIHCSVSVYPRP